MSLCAPPLKSLLDVFASIPSPRAARGVRYPLAAILALVLVAVLSGCKNVSQIAAFANSHAPLLKRLGFRRAKYPRKRNDAASLAAPSNDTLARNLASLQPEQFNEAFARFLARMVERGASAAIDGKALRGADEYVLSVFVNDLCQVAWQEDLGRDKENELSCLERSIETILSRYPHLRLFTGDAAFCHKTIVRALVQARRDYFLQLKAPHTGDVKLAQEAFAQLRHAPPAARSVEKRGGRAGRKS